MVSTLKSPAKKRFLLSPSLLYLSSIFFTVDINYFIFYFPLESTLHAFFIHARHPRNRCDLFCYENSSHVYRLYIACSLQMSQDFVQALSRCTIYLLAEPGSSICEPAYQSSGRGESRFSRNKYLVGCADVIACVDAIESALRFPFLFLS